MNDEYEDIIGCYIELEYDDLEVEVEGQFGGEPIADGMPMWYPISYSEEYVRPGIINDWVYIHEITEEDVIAYIKDELHEEPTEELISSVTEDDIYDFLKERCRKKAKKDALNNWDYDDVYWEEPEERDYYHEYNDYVDFMKSYSDK